MEDIIGNLVISLAGRDKNNIYIVYRYDGKYVYVVDGNLHKIINAKKKNLKHIKILNYKNEAIKNKITTNAKVFDSEIFSCIKKYKNQIDIFNIIWYNY